MGTMSKMQFNPGGRQRGSLRSTQPRGALGLAGTLLYDCLAVIAHKPLFNRKTRRVAASIWRKHAAAVGLTPQKAADQFKDMAVSVDSKAGVQGRFMALARK